MTPVQITTKLLNDSLNELDGVNADLEARGYPAYFLGQSGFNIEYRLANTPRWVFRWWPPGLRLSQIYLYYMPEIPEGQEPTRANEITVKLD